MPRGLWYDLLVRLVVSGALLIGCCNIDLAEQTSAYELVTASLAQSNLRASLRSRNWVCRVPALVGLTTITGRGPERRRVHNQNGGSSSPPTRRAAWISQQGCSLHSPRITARINMPARRPGPVHRCNRASTVRAPPSARFGQRIAGCARASRVGVWSLEDWSPLPVIVQPCSRYVTSTTSRRVHCKLQLLHGYREPSLPSANPVVGRWRSRPGPKAIQADLALHAVHRFNLVPVGRQPSDSSCWTPSHRRLTPPNSASKASGRSPRTRILDGDGDAELGMLLSRRPWPHCATYRVPFATPVVFHLASDPMKVKTGDAIRWCVVLGQ